MESQTTNNPTALALFFTEDVFAVADKNIFIEDIIEVKEIELEEISTVEKIAITEVKEYANQEEAPIVLANEPQPPITFQFLGNNAKGILILVFDKQNEVSTEAGNALLKKILKAAKIGKDDFALVNAARQSNCSLENLHNFFNPKVVLAFGVGADDLELHHDGEETRIKDNTILIFTKNLEFLEQDSAAKTILWNDLKSCVF